MVTQAQPCFLGTVISGRGRRCQQRNNGVSPSTLWCPKPSLAWLKLTMASAKHMPSFLCCVLETQVGPSSVLRFLKICMDSGHLLLGQLKTFLASPTLFLLPYFRLWQGVPSPWPPSVFRHWFMQLLFPWSPGTEIWLCSLRVHSHHLFPQLISC